MIRTRLLCGVMLLAILTASSGQTIRFGQRRPEEPQMTPDQTRALEKARQQERMKAMQRDAERLLELATELKQEVDRSGDHSLSLTVIRKAEQIEKLAHSVRTKMRGD